MLSQATTIGDGFQLDEPAVRLPWGVHRQEVLHLLPPHSVREEYGLMSITGRALNGLSCTISPLFLPRDRPPTGGVLRVIRIDRRGEPSPESYAEMQTHLETTFGQPTQIPSRGTEEWPYPEYMWVLGEVIVGHHADFNCGRREHTVIRKGGDPGDRYPRRLSER